MPIENCVTAPTVPVVDGIGISVDDGTGCGKTLLGPAGYYLRVNAAGDGLEWVEAHEPAHLETGAEPFAWDDDLQCGVIPLPGTLVDNGDGSFTFTPGDGADPTTIAWTVTNNDAPFSWDPATFTLNIPQAGTVVDNNNGTLTFNPGNGEPVVTFKQGWTEVATNGSVVTFTYPDDSEQMLDLCALVAASCADSLVDNGDGTLTHTAIDGTQMTFLKSGLTVNVVGDTLTFTLPDGTSTSVNLCSVIAANCADVLVDHGDGTFTHVSVGGASVTIDMRRATFANNGDGTFNLTDDFGNMVVVGGTETVTTLANVIVGNRIATYTNEAGVVVDIDETVTGLVDNGNGTLTYTDEAGIGTVVQPGWTTVMLSGSTLTFSYPDSTTVDLALPTGSVSSMAQGADTAGGIQTVVHDDGNGNTFTFCEGFEAVDTFDQCIVPANIPYVVDRPLVSGKTLTFVRREEHQGLDARIDMDPVALFWRDPDGVFGGLPTPLPTLPFTGFQELARRDGIMTIQNPSDCRPMTLLIMPATRQRIDTYDGLGTGVNSPFFIAQIQFNGEGWRAFQHTSATSFFDNTKGFNVSNTNWQSGPESYAYTLPIGGVLTIDARTSVNYGGTSWPVSAYYFNWPAIQVIGRTVNGI